MDSNPTNTGLSKTENALARYTEKPDLKGYKGAIGNLSLGSRCFCESSILKHALPSWWHIASQIKTYIDWARSSFCFRPRKAESSPGKPKRYKQIRRNNSPKEYQ